MSITVRAMRAVMLAVMLAVLLMFAVGATAGALSIAEARPALADDDDGRGDDDDDGRGDDDDDGRTGGDARGDDDDDDDDDRGDVAVGGDRVVPQGGVQTGAGGLASGTTAAWTLGGAGLLAGVGAVATWLRSRGASEDL